MRLYMTTKTELIQKTPCVAIFMDFCSSPFWEYNREHGFSSCNLWEEQIYELIPEELKKRFIDYQNKWEEGADSNFFEDSDHFELAFNDTVKDLAADLKKAIPELQVFYVKHMKNGDGITHSFVETF